VDQAAQELITRHNEQMRELIVRDIDALEEKLNVKRQVSLKADAATDKVKGMLGMSHTNQDESWGGFARHNAVPLAAIGVGGALLARNLRSRMDTQDTQSTTTRLVSDSSYVPYPGTAHVGEDGGTSRLSDKASDVKASAAEGVDAAKEKVAAASDTAKAKASEVADKASDAADTAKAKVADAKETVSTQAVHAKDVVVEHIPSRDEAKEMATDHYQLLGLAALAAGAVAGTFAPRTKLEERKLAPVQAQVKEKATTLVEDGVEKAKETADRAAEALSVAAETAKEEFADTGDDEPPSGSSSSDLPDLTRPNRITSSRSTNGATSGAGSSSGGGGTSY
jgi:hypothetical protein